MFIDPWKIIDLHTPTEAGTLLRGRQIDDNGQYRLARRDCELSSVKVLHGGSCGFLEVADWSGRTLFRMPSAFSGSFPLGCGAERGLVVMLHSDIPASILVSWREADQEDI